MHKMHTTFRRAWAGLLFVLFISVIPGCTGTNSPLNDDAQTAAPAHHDPRGGFRNPPGSPERTSSSWDMTKFIFTMIFGMSDPEVPADHVLSKSEQIAQLDSATTSSVTWLGHAAFIIRSGDVTVITDPFLGNTAGPFGIGPRRFVPASMTAEQLPRADVMLISHNHYDHLDASTIDAYPHKAETLVIVPLGLGKFFTSRGYANVLEQDWWQVWRSDKLTIQTLPAVHFSGRGIGDRNDTLWASFSIATVDNKIWFSGDTARGDIFKEVGERAGPFDYALVAIGAYDPRKIMQAVHVNPEEAIELVRAVGAKKAIGMHWGTIMLTLEDPFEVPRRFRQAAIDQRFGAENASVMRVGETRSLKTASR
jgi:L-ascorbate metabolism protein UlaG (beta-lactamase superfamily)